MIKVSQLINDNNNPAANQFIIEINKGTIFQSYDSVIAFYNKNDGKVYVTKDWDYSSTIRKHFYIFLRDYCNACGNIRKKDIEYEFKQGNYELVPSLDLEHLINL